jgi:hypothetical protein
MSLLSDAMEACTILDKRTVSDGYGGYISQYIDGAGFEAAVVRASSLEARIAEKQDAVAKYTVTTSRALNLQYHDVFKRNRDGKIFRVTSDGDDNYTPYTATLDMRNVDAEEWELPK